MDVCVGKTLCHTAGNSCLIRPNKEHKSVNSSVVLSWTVGSSDGNQRLSLQTSPGRAESDSLL